MKFTCPVCFFDGLDEPARPYNICDCCGTEFGVDDEDANYDELRNDWIARGARWFFGTPPIGWSAWTQMFMGNVGSIPYAVYPTFYGGSIQSATAELDEEPYLALAS